MEVGTKRIIATFVFHFFMQDVAALESLPLLGFVVKADSSQTSQFKLYHKNKVYYIFKADSPETAQKYCRERCYLLLHIVTILIILKYCNNINISFFFFLTDGSRLLKRLLCFNICCVKLLAVLALAENVLPQCSQKSVNSIWSHQFCAFCFY